MATTTEPTGVVGKTIGIVLIGLVGLLAYVAVYVGSVLHVGAALAVQFVGLALSAVLFLIVTVFALSPND